MSLQGRLKDYLFELGVSDVGFAAIHDGDFGDLTNAVSIVVKLSDAVIDEIGFDGPTHTYFSHYRAVNAFIDSVLLRAGLFLEMKGYRYIHVAASQSINLDGWDYAGRYSHKKVACLAGLGSIGKSGLFLHRTYGPRVRLGTLFTDYPLDMDKPKEEIEDYCLKCDICVKACPAAAISGKAFDPMNPDLKLIDPEKCSNHMKTAYKMIGRGAVCGICLSVCPHKNRIC